MSETRRLAPGNMHVDYSDLLEDPERVHPEDACPGCGEDRVDLLAWDQDGTFVMCLTCGAWYDPDEED